MEGVEGLEQAGLGIIEHAGNGLIELFDPLPQVCGVIRLAQGVADPRKGIHGQGVEAVEGALQPPPGLPERAVHGGRPLVEIPVVDPTVHALSVEILQNTLGL